MKKLTNPKKNKNKKKLLEAFSFSNVQEAKKYLGNDPLDLMTSEHIKTVGLANKINAKIISNYTNSILASSQAKKLGYSDALMLDINGNVSESPAANFFYEKDGELFTPTTEFAYDGITRRTIIELAKKNGIKVVERKIKLDELKKFSGCFLTGTAAEITPVSKIEDINFYIPKIVNKLWEDYSNLVRKKKVLDQSIA